MAKSNKIYEYAFPHSDVLDDFIARTVIPKKVIYSGELGYDKCLVLLTNREGKTHTFKMGDEVGERQHLQFEPVCTKPGFKVRVNIYCVGDTFAVEVHLTRPDEAYLAGFAFDRYMSDEFSLSRGEGVGLWFDGLRMDFVRGSHETNENGWVGRHNHR